jgi:DNA polymerase-3 subunit beta
MKLSLLQENLNSALSHVSRFVSPKTHLPILSNILFSTDSGRLKLTATNLEIGINYWIGAKIETEGSFTIPSKEISEFISYLPSGKIDLSLDKQQLLKLTSPKAESVFSTSPDADFPKLSSLDPSFSLELDSEMLRQTVTQVAFAAATDDSRPVLTAVYCLFSPDKLTIVGTDGFRLSLKEIKMVNPLDLDGKESLIYLIPSRSLVEISKLAKPNTKIKFGPTTDQNQLVFVMDDAELVSRLIEGEYPDYSRIIPETFSTKIFLNREEFAQAIKMASVFARESANVVKFSLKQNALEISSNAPQLGQNKITIDARIEGDPLDIAFNYKFVSDYLGVASGEEVIIELNESLSPGLFRDQADPSLIHIIMPVRIQD